jgi:hypothetical protein
MLLISGSYKMMKVLYDWKTIIDLVKNKIDLSFTEDAAPAPAPPATAPEQPKL